MIIAESAIKFAYWVPNVSGGLVVSTIEQRTDWSYEYNVRLAQAAEKVALNMRLHKSALPQAMVQTINMNQSVLVMLYWQKLRNSK